MRLAGWGRHLAILVLPWMALAACAQAGDGSGNGSGSGDGDGSGGVALVLGEEARRAQAVRAETLALAGRIWQAENLLDQRCMQRLGFTVHPRRTGQEYADHNPFPAAPSLEQARRYGYRGSTPAADAPATDAFVQLAPEEKRRYLEALDGGGSATSGIEIVLDHGRRHYVPDKGCRGQTLRTLFGDVRATAELNLFIEHGVVRAQRATAADERVVTVLRRWAECMGAQGHPGYGTPEDARSAGESYPATLGAEESWARERALAVAHATCAARVHLDKVRRMVWEGHLVADHVANEARLVALREAQLAALVHAQAALGNG